MFPPIHFVAGLIFSSICLFLFPAVGVLEAGIILASSVLIDIDHYIYYACKKKDLNPLHSYKWLVKENKRSRRFHLKEMEKVYVGFFFLHGAEVLFITLLLAFFVSNYFFFVFIGFFLHLFLDVIDERLYKSPLFKLSVIYDYLKLKKLRFIEDVKEK